MNKKITLFFIIFFAFILLSNTNVFASDDEIPYDASNYIEFERPANSSNIYRICADEPFYIIPHTGFALSETNMSAYKISDNSFCPIRIYKNGTDLFSSNGSSCYFESYQFYLDGDVSSIYSGEGTVKLYSSGSVPPDDENLVYSTLSSGDPQSPLVETMSQVEGTKVVEEILTLLPILMIVLSSMIALRKAWAFLKRSLVS